MRKVPTNFWGFSLTELLVAMLFAGVATTVLFAFFRDQLFRLRAQEMRVATLEDARGALDFMTRELRNAGVFSVATDDTCAKDASGNPLAIMASDGRSVEFQSDLDGDGDCSSPGERIAYRLTRAGPQCSVLTRNGSSLVGYCPVNGEAHRVNVRSPGGLLFTYYDSLDDPMDTDSPDFDTRRIKRIRIAMAVEENPINSAAGGGRSTALSSSVTLRN